MDFEINQNFADLAADEIAAYRAAAKEAFDAFLGLDTVTEEQVEQAEAIAAHIEAIDAEVAERAEREQALAARAEALQGRFSEQSEEDGAEEQVEASEEDAEEQVEEQVEEQPKARSAVVTLSKKVARPTAPTRNNTISITAAADVPDFSTGQDLNMDQVGDALVARMRAFGTPSGDGSIENLQHYGVAKFKMDFPDELTIKPHGDDMAVLHYAAKESRLDGNSLVAAGGWCAPSETLYDLCVTGETLDGIASVPEVNVTRGGIKFTSGPDFSTIYSSVGFLQTEAQAIAGTAKTCFEVPCPAFEEVRLDAIGLCIKAPILTNSAYPELVSRWLSGSMVAHAHKVNAQVLSRMETAAGAALAVNDFGSSAASTLANLELIADRLRQKYKMSLNATLEVIVPFWVKGAIRNDLALRTGKDVQAITDQMIASEFSVRNLSVQYVYDWQELADNAVTEGYPATFKALIYPAGTFVKGTSDVITLNAVYDAASLATNIYTALFFEQGLLVAQTCAEANVVTIPVCNAGRTGSANIVQCGLGAEV